MQRIERDAQQTALAAAQDSARDIEKRRRLQHTVLDDANSTSVPDDGDAGVIDRLRQKNRTGKASAHEWRKLARESRREWTAAVAGPRRIGMTRNNREDCEARPQ